MTVGKIIIAKFSKGDSMIPFPKELNKNKVPSCVNEIILVNIFPINSKKSDTKGVLRIKIAKKNCNPNPFKTKDQFIAFLFLLNNNAINNKLIIPKIPLSIDFIEKPSRGIKRCCFLNV